LLGLAIQFDAEQGALESLALAVGAQQDSTTPGESLIAPYAHTVQAILRDEGSTQLVLAMLELDGDIAEDFYVRYWTVQLLSQLVAAGPSAMQAAVLQRPQVRFPVQYLPAGKYIVVPLPWIGLVKSMFFRRTYDDVLIYKM
jgi:hypothetical protein